MSRCAISVGSNLGDRLANLRIAHLGLEALGNVAAVSGLYETAPVGGPPQDAYLNAVIVLDTALNPSELLTRCQAIEVAAGRERTERWGPRTLDIDLITFDGGWEDTDELQLPHPRAADREFVIRPLFEVWPEAPLSGGMTAAEVLADLEPQGVELLTRHWVTGTSTGTWLVIAQLALIGAAGVAMAVEGSLDFRNHPVAALAGAVLLLVGLLLGLSSGRALGSALSPHPEPSLGGKLVDSGPYRFVRHPMYTGVLFVVAGAALVVDSRLALIGSLLLLALLWAKSTYEEGRLRIRYAQYRDYQERVRHRFVPGVL